MKKHKKRHYQEKIEQLEPEYIHHLRFSREASAVANAIKEMEEYDEST